jgi:hypothetical protein
MIKSYSKTIQAAVWMTGSIVSFSAMAVSGREISYELDTFEIMLYRSIIGLVIVLLLASLLIREKKYQHKSFHFIFSEIYHISQDKTFGFML